MARSKSEQPSSASTMTSVLQSRPTAIKCTSDTRTLPEPPSSTFLDPPKLSQNSIYRSSWALSPGPLPGGRQRRPPRRRLGERVQELQDRISRQFRGGQGGSRRGSGRVRVEEVHFVAAGLFRSVLASSSPPWSQSRPVRPPPPPPSSSAFAIIVAFLPETQCSGVVISNSHGLPDCPTRLC